MRLLISAPALLLLVLFALSNTQPVRLGLWPFDVSWELPLSLAVLLGMALGALMGGVMVWWGERGRRRQAREAVHRAQLAGAHAAPVPPPK